MKSAFRTTLLAAATLAAFGASSAFAAGRPDLVAQGLAQGKPHVAGELIIQFRDGASDGDKVRALKRANGERVEMLARGRDRLYFAFGRSGPGLLGQDRAAGDSHRAIRGRMDRGGRQLCPHPCAGRACPSTGPASALSGRRNRHFRNR